MPYRLGRPVSKSVGKLCKGVAPGDDHRKIAMALAEAERAAVLLGLDAANGTRHSDAVRALAAAIASDATGATFGYVSEGANSAGLHLAGVLPHRAAGGEKRDKAPGKHTADLAADDLDSVLLYFRRLSRASI